MNYVGDDGYAGWLDRGGGFSLRLGLDGPVVEADAHFAYLAGSNGRVKVDRVAVGQRYLLPSSDDVRTLLARLSQRDWSPGPQELRDVWEPFVHLLSGTVVQLDAIVRDPEGLQPITLTIVAPSSEASTIRVWIAGRRRAATPSDTRLVDVEDPFVADVLSTLERDTTKA